LGTQNVIMTATATDSNTLIKDSIDKPKDSIRKYYLSEVYAHLAYYKWHKLGIGGKNEGHSKYTVSEFIGSHYEKIDQTKQRLNYMGKEDLFGIKQRAIEGYDKKTKNKKEYKPFEPDIVVITDRVSEVPQYNNFMKRRDKAKRFNVSDKTVFFIRTIYPTVEKKKFVYDGVC